MEESSFERACMLAIAIIVGIVLAVVTAAPQWAMSSEAAAWVQAVGSIAAIVFSLRVARRQTAAQEGIEQKRRDLEVQDRKATAHRIAVDHAIVIFPSVFAWELEMSRIEEGMDPSVGGTQLARLVHAHREILECGIPQPVQDLFGRFHVLDSAAQSVQMAVIAALTLRETKSQLEMVVRREVPEGFDREAMVREIEGNVRMQIRCVKVARGTLAPFFSAKNWRMYGETS